MIAEVFYRQERNVDDFSQYSFSPREVSVFHLIVMCASSALIVFNAACSPRDFGLTGESASKHKTAGGLAGPAVSWARGEVWRSKSCDSHRIGCEASRLVLSPKQLNMGRTVARRGISLFSSAILFELTSLIVIIQLSG